MVAFILLYYFSFLMQIHLNACYTFIDSPDNFTEVNKQLEKLANTILDIYFNNNRCIVVLSEEGLLENLTFNNTITYYEPKSESEDCHIDIYGYFKQTFAENCDGYMVQLRNPLCAMKGWETTNRERSVARHNPKFFFLPVYPSTLTYAEELMSMRITDISQYILAAEIIENATDWTVVLSTNNFYKHPLEADREPMIYLDEWHPSTGFKENAHLYPDKIVDMKGKHFRVATSKYLPYTIYEPLDGLEIRLAYQFCEVHNCTVTGYTDDFLWGTVYENKSGNGVLGNVYLDHADIGALAVFLWLNESYYIDYSDSYLRGEVSVMTPKPKRLGGWMVLFLPFRYDMWIAFFVSLFLSAVSLLCITRASIRYTRFGDLLKRKMQFTTIDDSIIRAVGLAVLQQPSSRLIGDSPNRYLFTSFELLYFILSAMYSAELASFLTVPLYSAPIDTFHDFAQSGIKWYATHEAFIFALMGSPQEDAQLVVNNFEVLPMDELKAKAKEGKYGFTAERLAGGEAASTCSVTEQDHITADVIPMYHIMKDYLFGSPLVVSIKKGGPYNFYYNKIINMAIEHGLTLYWEGEVARIYLDSRMQAEYSEAKTLHVDNTPSVLQVSHIHGTLYLYAIGLCLSFIIFAVEMIHYNLNELKIVIKSHCFKKMKY